MQRGSRVFYRQATKEAALHHVAEPFVERFQLFQRFLEVLDVLEVLVLGETTVFRVDDVERDMSCFIATLDGAPVAGVVREDLTHRSRCDPKEMQSRRCMDLIRSAELQERFMDQGSGSERRIPVPSAAMVARDRAELVVDDWIQSIQRSVVPAFELRQEPGDRAGVCLPCLGVNFGTHAEKVGHATGWRNAVYPCLKRPLWNQPGEIPEWRRTATKWQTLPASTKRCQTA